MKMKQQICLLLGICCGMLGALDRKYFPGIPTDFQKKTDRVLLKAADWNKQNGIAIRSNQDGLIAELKVPTQWGNAVSSANTVPVKPGNLLKVTSCYYLQEAPSGSRFTLNILLLDRNDKVLARMKATSAASKPPEHLNWDENYTSIPGGCVKARAELLFHGNPMKVHLVSLQLDTVAAKDPLPDFPPKITYRNRALNDAALTRKLAERTKIRTGIASNGDLVEFLVNGTPTPLKIYKNNTCTTIHGYPEYLRKTPAMQKAGFNVFTVCVYLGVPGHTRTANTVWLGPGRYQVDVIRKAMREILKYAPDAMILLELYITPSPEWSAAHPDEIVQYVDGRKAVQNGTRIHQLTDKPPQQYVPVGDTPWTMPYWVPSYFSEKFTEDASRAIRDIFAELEKSPESNALAGVFLCRGVDGQWFDLFAEIPAKNGQEAIYPLADYSPASLKYFQNFLRGKYKNDIAELRRAWNDPDVRSFEEIRIPLHREIVPSGKDVMRKRAGRDRIADFIESRGDGMAKQFIRFCRAVKEGSGGRILVGGYRAEGAPVSWPFLTQQCSRQMYSAPEVDFFASCPGGRTPENPVMPSLLNGSLRLHNKLAITELDFRVPWVWNWGPRGEPIYYKTHDQKEFQERSMRAQLFASAYGGAFHAYDMDGNWYDTEMAQSAWRNNNRIYDLRKPRPLSENRIALFYSEHYWEYMSLSGNRAFAHIVKNDPRIAMTRSGVDADLYLLDDVLHPDFKAPRVLWFADALELTPGQAAEIRKRHANSGRVLVWAWAPGAGSVEDIGKVAGFRLERAPEADGRPVLALENTGDPLMDGVRNLVLATYRPYVMGPVWKVTDPDAVVLGHYLGTKVPAMAVKRYPDHTEVFIGQGGNATPALVRNIAREAGAHCWNESDDPTAQAGNLLICSAASSGKKKIFLPDNVTDVRSLTGQPVSKEDQTVFCTLQYGEVLVLELTFRD